MGIVAVVLAKKAKEVYVANPELYTGYQNVKTGRILAIIGIVLGSIYVITYITLIAIYGFAGLAEMQQEMLGNYGM